MMVSGVLFARHSMGPAAGVDQIMIPLTTLMAPVVPAGMFGTIAPIREHFAANDLCTL